MGKRMIDNEFDVATVFGTKDFQKVALNAIRKGLNLDDRECITINTISFQIETNDNLETFFINATVKGVSLLFKLLMHCQTGDVWSLGLSASVIGFNYQFDYMSKTLVGGYSSDGETYMPALWITSVPIDKVSDVFAMFWSFGTTKKKYSGSWKNFSKWFQKHCE